MGKRIRAGNPKQNPEKNPEIDLQALSRDILTRHRHRKNAFDPRIVSFALTPFDQTIKDVTSGRKSDLERLQREVQAVDTNLRIRTELISEMHAQLSKEVASAVTERQNRTNAPEQTKEEEDDDERIDSAAEILERLQNLSGSNPTEIEIENWSVPIRKPTEWHISCDDSDKLFEPQFLHTTLPRQNNSVLSFLDAGDIDSESGYMIFHPFEKNLIEHDGHAEGSLDMEMYLSMIPPAPVPAEDEPGYDVEYVFYEEEEDKPIDLGGDMEVSEPTIEVNTNISSSLIDMMKPLPAPTQPKKQTKFRRKTDATQLLLSIVDVPEYDKCGLDGCTLPSAFIPSRGTDNVRFPLTRIFDQSFTCPGVDMLADNNHYFMHCFSEPEVQTPVDTIDVVEMEEIEPERPPIMRINQMQPSVAQLTKFIARRMSSRSSLDQLLREFGKKHAAELAPPSHQRMFVSMLHATTKENTRPKRQTQITLVVKDNDIVLE